MAEADEAACAEKWLKWDILIIVLFLSQEGPMYVFEVKDGTSEAEFQDFIDGPDGVNMGMKSFEEQHNEPCQIWNLLVVSHLTRENLLN